MDSQEELLNKYYLVGTLDRIEGDKLVIKLNDGQEILWPKSKISEEIKEGDVVKIKLSTSQSEAEERKKIVKKLLEEMLNHKN